MLHRPKTGSLADRENVDRWIRAIAGVYQRTDRLVSGDSNLTVEALGIEQLPSIELAEVAGWTDGQDIKLNRSLLTEMIARAKTDRERAEIAASVYGVNLHELAHNLFTPRVGEGLSAQVQAFGRYAWSILNILEDQRAETLFAALYAPAEVHFMRVALEQILKRNASDKRAGLWMLFVGRSWIPATVVETLRQQFDVEWNGLSSDIAPLISEYLTLRFPADASRGLEIILEIVRLTEKANDGEIDFPCHPGGNHGEQISGSVDGSLQEDASERAAEKAAKAAQNDSPGSSEFDDADDAGESPESDDDEETDDDAGSGEESGSDEPTPAPQDSDDSGETTGAEQNAEGGNDHGDGVSDSANKAPTPEQLAGDVHEKATEALSDLADSADWDAERRQMSRSLQRELDRAEGGIAQGERLNGTPKPVTPEMRIQLRKVQRAFDDLRAQLEASWMSHQASGRLDVIDYINADHGDFDVFDHFEPGNEDESGVEIVLLIDRSSSMSPQDMNKVSQAVWVIRQALHRLDGRVTVLAYDHRHFVCTDQSESPSRTMYPSYDSQGSTNPGESLIEARRILKASHRPNRLLVTLTDGGWVDTVSISGARRGVEYLENDDIMRSIGDSGVVTALFGIGRYTLSHYGQHGAQVGHSLYSINDLPGAVESLVAESMIRHAGMAVGA